MKIPTNGGSSLSHNPFASLNLEGFPVRLKNDVLITETGVVDLMAHIPIEADDIESLMAGKRR